MTSRTFTSKEVALLRATGALPEPVITPADKGSRPDPTSFATGAWLTAHHTTVAFDLPGCALKGSFDPGEIGADNKMLERLVASVTSAKPRAATPSEQEVVNRAMARALTAAWDQLTHHARVRIEAQIAGKGST